MNKKLQEIKSLEKCALQEGRYITLKNSSLNTCSSPFVLCNYTFSVYLLKKFEIKPCNVFKTLSLLHIKNIQETEVAKYKSKISIMTINVYRLKYTEELFKRIGTINYKEKAIKYMIDFDIKTIEDKKYKHINEKFSNLLHILRKSGYKSYILCLITFCKCNLDIIQKDKTVWQYKLVEEEDSLSSFALSQVRRKRPTLTVFIKNEDEWLVEIY